MKYSENIRQLDKTGIDMMGFIFHEKSPRHVSEKPEYLPVNTLRVGVFVDKDVNYILSKSREFHLDIVQLHGKESPETCAYLRKNNLEVIKAFHVEDVDADVITSPYSGLCKFFLFDTPCREHGGSGKKFNWKLLDYYHGDTPFLLSGGLNPDSLTELKSFKHPKWAGVDLNSGFELSPGLKDIESLSIFTRTIKL